MRFTPGPGVGGHCLPIDPSFLSWRVRDLSGHAFRFVELANDVNRHMPEYVARRIVLLLNRHSLAVNGRRILLLGLTYKAGASDFRESPSLALADRLLALGADLRAADPHVPTERAGDFPFPLVEYSAAEVAAADLVVVLVDHPEFVPEDVGRARLVFDAKGMLRGREYTGECL
jgi:UDP-N-acetyl-D-mannosaminuronic acid dehydrogenase/UDP-N-acetyl-D-glucosamine dehydrogenase